MLKETKHPHPPKKNQCATTIHKMEFKTINMRCGTTLDSWKKKGENNQQLPVFQVVNFYLSVQLYIFVELFLHLLSRKLYYISYTFSLAFSLI